MKILALVFFALTLVTVPAHALEGASALGEAGAAARAAFAESEAKRVAIENAYNTGAMADEDEAASSIRAELDEHRETVRIFPSTGRVPPTAKVRYLLLHGMGMSYSSAGSWHNVINALGALESGKSGSTINFLQNHPDYLHAAVEAIDLMEHRAGPNNPIGFRLSFADSVKWLIAYLKDMRRQTPTIPLVVVARSASARYVAEVNRREPDLISGIVFISPTVPGGRQRNARQYQGAVAEVGDDIASLDIDIINWFFRSTRGLNWLTPGYFGNTPVLTMTGSLDTQVLEEDRADLQTLANTYKNFEYVNLEGAGHNLLATNGKSRRIGREAYSRLLQFSNRRVFLPNQNKIWVPRKLSRCERFLNWMNQPVWPRVAPAAGE